MELRPRLLQRLGCLCNGLAQRLHLVADLSRVLVQIHDHCAEAKQGQRPRIQAAVLQRLLCNLHGARKVGGAVRDATHARLYHQQLGALEGEGRHRHTI
jgi:hypothetical protein